MKKILSILCLGAAMLTSCDMDKAPAGSLDNENALQSVNDFYRFRNGIYSSVRGMTVGSWLYVSDIQSDQFLGLTIAGNRNGEFNNGSFTASSGHFESFWSSLYGRIANANYFLEKIEGAIDGGSFTDDEMASLKLYEAEAHFARAYYYWWMMDRYCQQYTADKGDTPALGLPLVTKFAPSGNSGTYPGRSTMNETLKLINDDLDKAYTGLSTYQNPKNIVAKAPYLNTNVVEAFRARIALATGDYATAVTKSQAVINSGVYALTTGQAYIDMWSNDDSQELIFSPFVDQAEYSTIGYTSEGYISYQNTQTADYIPTMDVLFSYEDNDIRFDAFFTAWNLSFEGNMQPAFVFYKYPGNKSIVNGTDYRKNKPKPFRLSEQYLILAEAAAASNQETVANDALNTLRSARISGYEHVTLSGNNLRDAIRAERGKELIGEGFRLSDLRRWHIGFQREGDYVANTAINPYIVPLCLSVVYTADDTRYTWPIPTSEMQINPQLEGQQNPGY